MKSKVTLQSPMNIGNVQLKNRLILAPMQQNKGTLQAMPTDYHVKHYRDRAKHVGLVIIESTGVSANGRLYPNDIGIFTDEHTGPLRRIVEAVHEEHTPIFIQLTHGGRKAWPEVVDRLVAPSAIAYDDFYGVPEEMTSKDIREAISEFRFAARRSVQAGFDGIELHLAHGHLLHQFLSPLSNLRSDEYGGSLENRLRIIREVVIAIREEVGCAYPLQIRVSASDFAEGGLTPVDVAHALTYLEEFIDAVHVSAGGTLPVAPLADGAGYQVPYASVIKQYVKVPVIAVGRIHSGQLANFILADELADFIAVGRPMQEDPHFAQKLLQYEE
ncbi:NADH:flavin oxidoreductase [Brevibacillus choshinensis]|uniref:NADH:flavin oxidoreductase n=1 Tax=Brevibacillus choshinensis TaxID=54911 RepID=A0ABX7FVJ3_BRECH|nr:NADH:flavin oxidoreductase [Brevibacillus choshinensis]QRG69010.1 NADH:flavin oxidoreductase [Brevibacillus choshinensis]